MKRPRHFLKFFILVLALVSFSCKDNFAQLKLISQFDSLPVGEADTIRVVYTEFARTVAVLTAPKNIDYTNQPFPYSEFPNGVQVVLYDENDKETHVKADYGIMYSKTDIVDLKGNVLITTPQGAMLNTSQLYWDINKEWVFTQEYFTFKNEDYDIAANVLDASRSFDKITTGPLVGNVLVEEEL
jgi:LPS export ABC transporter protein LptC